MIQRDNLGKVEILVEGTYRKFKTIEARWNESTTWTTLTLNDIGAGTFSGNSENQLQGQVLLKVRFSYDILI